MANLFDSLDWALVQTFAAVARYGSLSGAARALGTSQPTVGRQIKSLEDALGVSLFTRQPRGLALTQTGAELLPHAQRMEETVNALGLAAAGRTETLSGPVRITASLFTAHHILPPMLALLRQQEPRISIDLMPNDATDNLLFREADIALRMYRAEQLDIVTRHLGELELGLFAARSYLQRAGTPRTLDEMLQRDMIGYDRSDLMIRGMRDVGIPATRASFATRCDNNGVYHELLRAGCGIGVAQARVAGADPQLVRLFPEFPLPTLPLYLAAHEAMRQTPRVRRVWDHLARHLSEWVIPGSAGRPAA
ncbi:MAG: LysR family transcriptional regulator [Roseivivax sp.]|nr:LysR family transcriptional regulator [Roseivivax sp.]